MINILLGVLKCSFVVCASVITIFTLTSISSGIVYGMAECFKRWEK